MESKLLSHPSGGAAGPGWWGNWRHDSVPRAVRQAPASTTRTTSVRPTEGLFRGGLAKSQACANVSRTRQTGGGGGSQHALLHAHISQEPCSNRTGLPHSEPPAWSHNPSCPLLLQCYPRTNGTGPAAACTQVHGGRCSSASLRRTWAQQQEGVGADYLGQGVCRRGRWHLYGQTSIRATAGGSSQLPSQHSLQERAPPDASWLMGSGGQALLRSSWGHQAMPPYPARCRVHATAE